MVGILFFLTLTDIQAVSFNQTRVYQPLRTDEVIVAEDGELLVLAFDEARIHIYDASGVQKKTIGGKGQGPGEFVYPNQFWYQDQKIYVFDLQSAQISLFHKDGTFIERWKAPGRDIILEKVSNGWLYGNWNAYAPASGTVALKWASERFDEQKVVMKIEDAGSKSGLSTWQVDGGKRSGVFSPIQNRPILAVSPNGDQAYLTDTRSFTIHVVDVKTQQIHRTLTRNEPMIPFDQEWADVNFKLSTQNFSEPVDWEKAYPEYFPAIRSLRVSPKGHLIVDRWRGRPDAGNHYVTLTPKGQVVDKQWNGALLNRLAGYYKDEAFVLCWNSEEEEAYVTRLPKSAISDFVAQNPIDYNGPRGRDIHLSY